MEDRLYDGDPSRAARTRRTLERVRGHPEDILESRRTKKDFEIGREDIWRTMSLAQTLDGVNLSNYQDHAHSIKRLETRLLSYKILFHGTNLGLNPSVWLLCVSVTF